MVVKKGSRSRFLPKTERLEERHLLSFVSGSGAQVTGLLARNGRTSNAILISFDGPLNASQAQNVANYQVNGLVAGVNPEIVTTSGRANRVVSAIYNGVQNQVSLTLARPLQVGTFSRVFINGTPGTGITDANGNTIDGDFDNTAAGDFYGLVGTGSKLNFRDSDGDQATIKLLGGGRVSLWRELNGNVNQLTILGPIGKHAKLTESVNAAKGSDGSVVIPSVQGSSGINTQITASLSGPPASASPTPLVATSANLAYSLQITPVSMPNAPTLQSAAYAQADGKWLLFGGRTNGLHNFNSQATDPDGTLNFPPRFQNNDIFVIDPATGQVWTQPWSATGLPVSVTASLSATNQEFYQSGDRLYTVGGYSYNATTSQFTTYDTLSAISVSGLINAVMTNGTAQGQVKQIHDNRFRVTGGDMSLLGNRAYLVFGQDFQGGYNGAGANLSQVYTNEIRSFEIVDSGDTLAIANYQAQRDSANFRRRDGNLAEPVVLPNGDLGLTAFGGVFTPGGAGYRTSIVIGSKGNARVNTKYHQYFNQYSAAKVGLYDAKSGAMHNVFFGGISLYDYNFATSTLSNDPGLPFVNDVTAVVRSKNGSTQEYILPSQLPVNFGPYTTPSSPNGPNYYGAEAAFFDAPGLPAYANGVLKLNEIQGPTVLGYIYGGIVANAGNFGTSTASGVVFRVTLIPN